MSTREMAFTLIEHMTESDLQLFLSLFGRLYPKQDDESETDTEIAVQLKRLTDLINL